jgi:hypothetical protein
MGLILYTYGYANGNIEDLHRYVRDGAVVLDIRYSPNSYIPGWGKERLEAALRDEYRWVHDLGNRNYRDGPVQIVNMDRGMGVVEGYVDEDTPVVLLCACRDLGRCHRKLVAQEAAARFGVQVIHLKPGEDLLQPP